MCAKCCKVLAKQSICTFVPNMVLIMSSKKRSNCAACLPSSLTACISTHLLTLNDTFKLPPMVSFGSFHPSWWIVTLIWWDLLSIWSQLISLTLLVYFLQALLVFLTLAWVDMVVLMYWMMSGVVEEGILVCNWYGQFPMFLADFSYSILLLRQGIDY